MWGSVGFMAISWACTQPLPSPHQPPLASPSWELRHLVPGGREQPSRSACCCDLGWCPSELASFGADFCRFLPRQLCPVPSPPGCPGNATSGAASPSLHPHLGEEALASPLRSATGVTPASIGSGACCCTGLRVLGTWRGFKSLSDHIHVPWGCPSASPAPASPLRVCASCHLSPPARRTLCSHLLAQPQASLSCD